MAIEKGAEAPEINFAHLKKSFQDLKKDLIKQHEEYFEKLEDFGPVEVLTQEQKNELLSMDINYYDTWFFFVMDFVDNSLYLNTHKKSITNELNRHAILHEYGLKIEYNLENYIKIYFVLTFLTWVFLRKEGESVLNEIETFRFFEKAIAYRNIIKQSERLSYDKHILYKGSKGYNPDLLRNNHKPFFESPFPQKLILKYHLLRKASKAFWKRFGIDA